MLGSYDPLALPIVGKLSRRHTFRRWCRADFQSGMHPPRRYNYDSTATITGTATAGVPTPVVATFPAFDGHGNATFDASWTGVTSVSITITASDPNYSLVLLAIYYLAL